MPPVCSSKYSTSIATDCHTGIALLYCTEYPHINHYFDVRHVFKDLMKNLTKVTKQSGKQDLSPWTKSQSAITCGGHVRHGRGMHFVSRRSRFPFSIIAATSTLGNSEKFTSCAHPPLDLEKIDGTQWLTPGSTIHQALQPIVLKKTLIKTLDQVT